MCVAQRAGGCHPAGTAADHGPVHADQDRAYWKILSNARYQIIKNSAHANLLCHPIVNAPPETEIVSGGVNLCSSRLVEFFYMIYDLPIGIGQYGLINIGNVRDHRADVT